MPSVVLPEVSPELDTTKIVSNLDVTISRFILDGADPALAALADRRLAPLRNRRVPVDAIYAAVAELEQEYVDEGHFLTRVVIPPQHVADGSEMTLRVIHGFIQWLDLDGVPAAQRLRVSSILTPLTHNSGITRRQFERALLVAGDLPGLTLRASLRTGPEVGAVILVLAGEPKSDHGQIAVDNTLPTLLGGASATLSSAYTADWGPIDQLYFTGSAPVSTNSFSADSPRTLVAGGVRSAMGVGGAGVDANITWSRTKPKSSPGVLATESTFDRAALRGTYPLVKTRATTFIAYAAFDATAEQETAPQFGRILYDDQLRVFRVGLSAVHVFNRAWQGSASLDVSKGLHALGSRGPGEESPGDPLSQQGASDTFTKWEWYGSLRRDLGSTMVVELQAHGQQASRPLLLAEKFVLGGSADLSAYDSASFSGDRGWAIRGEFQRRVDWHVTSWLGNGQVYVFGARGEVVLFEPTAAERPASTASSAGLGIRTTNGMAGETVGPVEVNTEFAREFNSGYGEPPDRWRAHFSLVFHF
jgi:hemolysin activation/secretion protein